MLNRRDMVHMGALGTCSAFLPLGARSILRDGTALAQTAASPTLVHFVLIDKVQAALFQNIPGTPPPGADADGGVAQRTSEFRNLGLTELFGNDLQGLPENIGLAMNNTWESGSNGHSLANSTLGAGLGSINHVFANQGDSASLLGPVGFRLRSDANDSRDAFRDGNGVPMQAFTSVRELSETVSESIAPLTKIREQSTLISRLDSLVTSDTSIRTSMDSMIDQIQGAVTSLDDAAQTEDPIDAQVNAVIALSQAGLSQNFMIAIPWDDTNSGGNLRSGGGVFDIDPFSATPRIAQALVKLHQAIPNLFTVSTSDGGRSANNGDRSAGFGFLTGPQDKVANALIGGAFTGPEQLGNRIADASMSDGSSSPTRPENWYATALAAMGIKTEVPHALQALS